MEWYRRGSVIRRALLAAALLVPAPVFGQVPAQVPDVGFVGVLSADLSAAEIAAIQSHLDAQLAKGWRTRSREETIATALADGDVAQRLSQARAAGQSGDAALRALELAKARTELDRALSLYDSMWGERLVPLEVSKLLEQRATLAFALRKPEEMRLELHRLSRVHPTKELDAKVFPPEAIAVFEAELDKAKADPAIAQSFGDLAKRARVEWVLAADAHVESGALVLTLLAGAADGRFESELVRVPKKDSLPDLLTRGLSNLLTAARVPRAAIAVATPTPLSLSSRALPIATPTPRVISPGGPLYTRWWFWTLIVVAGAGAGFAASNAAAREETPGNVTVIFDPH